MAENIKPETTEEVHDAYSKKINYENENSKKQESRMMNFFNQEFFDRKIDFKPKKTLNDPKILGEDIKTSLSSAKTYEKLLEIEKGIDEKMYRTRLEIQENLIMPTPKVKSLLRANIFSYFISNKDENKMIVDDSIEVVESKQYWVLRIQGKIMPVLDSQPGGFFRKFSYFFHKILVKFENEAYQEIEWSRSGGSDTDGFEIKRKTSDSEPINVKIFFYLNTSTQECKLSDELSNLLGIKQESRPRILYHMWQFIKLNSLQENDNPSIIINNKEMRNLFKCDKLEINTLYARLTDHIKPLDPIVVDYTIKQVEDWTTNQKLLDIIVNIDDPHFLDISNFLSNADNESLLFPKSLFFYKTENQQKTDKSQSEAEVFHNKVSEIDRNIIDLVEKIKKTKYKYDFYESYSKDPTKFVNNFLLQQNSLLKIMKEESSIIDARWDYNSSQYYKDYEDILRDYADSYLVKIRNEN